MRALGPASWWPLGPVLLGPWSQAGRVGAYPPALVTWQLLARTPVWTGSDAAVKSWYGLATSTGP